MEFFPLPLAHQLARRRVRDENVALRQLKRPTIAGLVFEDLPVRDLLSKGIRRDRSIGVRAKDIEMDLHESFLSKVPQQAMSFVDRDSQLFRDVRRVEMRGGAISEVVDDLKR